MRFSVLGPVGVVVDRHPVSAARGHERTLLAILLAADGDTVSTDHLIEALWPGVPPISARKSLQSHLSRLRRYLREHADDGIDRVQNTPDGYRIEVIDAEVDARQFVGLVARARHAQTPHESLALLEAAEACWRGPAFGDLAHHPSVIDAAHQLERQRRAATTERAAALQDLGRYDDLVEILPAIIAEDPYNERVYAQLMHALVATGRRAEALTTFDQLRTWLSEELGIDPNPELRRLHQEILRQDTLPSGTGLPTMRATGARRTTPLLGRDRDLDELSAELPGASLLTLTGPGGVGKTCLAEHLVNRTRETWRDGVMYCPLAHIRDPEGVGGALITALTIQSAREQTVTQALISGLGERRLLIFLDNCEHVLEAITPFVDAIVTECPNVTVLATSRERLRLSSEKVWPVEPLDVPPSPASGTQVLGTSAGALFHARARAADPTFVLDQNNASAVAELCRRLDGLPLAIELAAARVRALSPQALVERLDHRFAVLAGGPRYEGGRHRTLEAVVTWSYDLLAPAEADLFDRLAVFAGAAPLTALEAVCADETLASTSVAGLLGELVDKSMVSVVQAHDDVRFGLLETMRDFGMQRLEDRGIAERAQRAHAAHYVALVQSEAKRARGGAEVEAVATITAAMDDLRAAHAWAIARGEIDVALHIPGALGDEVAFRLRDEVTTWARRGLALPGAHSHPARPYALTTSAWGSTSRDECERAVQEATAAYQAVDPESPVAMSAVCVIATAALYQGRLADVLTVVDQHHRIAQEVGNDYHGAFLWACRILAHLYRADFAAAADAIPAIHEAADRSASPTMQAFAHYCEGEVQLEQDPDRATGPLKAAVRLGRKVHNRLVEGVALVCLASSQGRRGNPTEALGAYRDVVVHWRRVGDHTHQLTAVRNLVTLLAQMGIAREAASLYGAVTSADTPTFGVEEQRLVRAWDQIQFQLGTADAGELAAHGRATDTRLVGDEALAVLDALLDGEGDYTMSVRSVHSRPTTTLQPDSSTVMRTQAQGSGKWTGVSHERHDATGRG